MKFSPRLRRNSPAFLTASLVRELATKSLEQEYIEPEEDVDTHGKIHKRIQQDIEAPGEMDKDTVIMIGKTVTFYSRHNDVIVIPIKVMAD